MAEDEKRKLDIPWATLLPLFAALAGILAQYKPLVSTRPAAPSEKPVEVIADQNIDARLWQDPLGVAHKQKADLEADLLVKKVPDSRVRRHATPALAARIKETIGEAKDNSVLLLAVMLESGPYLEQAESRLRARRAVLEGLSESGFIPVDSEHIGFAVERPWPPASEISPDDPPGDGSLLIAWEQCKRANDFVTWAGPQNTIERVFVLWLPAAGFNPRPLANFASLVTKLAPESLPPETRAKLEVRMIGPANSTGLQAMLREAEDWKAGKNHKPEYDDALDGVSIFSALATASEEALFGDLLPTGYSLKEMIEEGVQRKSRGGLQLHRTILTDDEVLRGLIEELPLRHVHVVPWRDKRGNWRPADHVVILSEWDSAYGRALDKTFQTEAEASRPTDAPLYLKPEIHSYRYMHGIDGRLPGDSAKDDRPADSSKTQSTSAPAEATEGLNQSDFLRRLARSLKEEEKRWQRSGQGGVRAVGLLGSDIYDKMMILRALRPAFPSAVFFTNNYDAHFERMDQWDDVHNLVISSPFGGTLPQRQERVAPFRDNNQTSMYAGTLRALGTIADSHDLVRQPHLFEISRKGAYELLKPADPASSLQANEIAARGVPAWLRDRKVQWSLAIGMLALFLMIGSISLSIVDRRSPLAEGLRDRLMRQAGSTAACLLLGVPLIVLAIAMLAQTGDAQLEPLAFFSGISIWPSEMLRLMALMLAIHFLVKAHLGLQRNEGELTSDFDLAPVPTEKWALRKPLSGLRPWWKEHPEWARKDAQFTARDAWSAYLSWNQFWPRVIRVGALTVIYLVFSVSVFGLLGLPVTPARGDIALSVDKLILGAAVLGMMILTFYVVDAIRLNSNLIRIVAGGVTQWEPNIAVGGNRIPPLTREDLARYHDVAFIAGRTEGVAPLIWYPLIVLAVMVVARSSFFDNWSWPVSIILVFSLNALWAFGSAAFLRRSAEQLRKAAIGKLQLLRVESYESPERRQMFDELIAEIRGLKKGAFAPLSEQPFIRAVILPSGGLGLLAVAQRLLEIF